MLKFLCSRKGFTLTEILAVVLILGILTGVAVPIFASSLKKQRQDDCRNQRLVIEAAVKQAMYGMIDNGKRQPIIDFNKLQNDHYCIYKKDLIDGNADDAYNGKKCFVLWYDKFNSSVEMHTATKASNQQPMTLEDLRGGYRPVSEDDDKVNGLDYDEGCAQGYYLKKKKYKAHDENGEWIPATKFYVFLDNAEIPVCPFANEDYKKNNTAPEYMYFIFEDGTVLCSNPECH